MTLKDTLANLRYCEASLGIALLQAQLAGRHSLASKIRSGIRECLQLRQILETDDAQRNPRPTVHATHTGENCTCRKCRRKA